MFILSVASLLCSSSLSLHCLIMRDHSLMFLLRTDLYLCVHKASSRSVGLAIFRHAHWVPTQTVEIYQQLLTNPEAAINLSVHEIQYCPLHLSKTPVSSLLNMAATLEIFTP